MSLEAGLRDGSKVLGPEAAWGQSRPSVQGDPCPTPRAKTTERHLPRVSSEKPPVPGLRLDLGLRVASFFRP